VSRRGAAELGGARFHLIIAVDERHPRAGVGKRPGDDLAYLAGAPDPRENYGLSRKIVFAHGPILREMPLARQISRETGLTPPT
jgi:hypothetical protein